MKKAPFLFALPTQQPPTEKVLNFNMIFHDSTKKYAMSLRRTSKDLKFFLPSFLPFRQNYLKILTKTPIPVS